MYIGMDSICSLSCNIGRYGSMPNAGAQPRPKAGATQERTLEGVGCSTWFGDVVLLDPWSPPENHFLCLGVESPYPQPSVGGTHDGAHAFDLRIQSVLPQYTTHKDGHLL